MSHPFEVRKVSDTASASLWLPKDLRYSGGRVGCLGKLSAANEEDASRLLDVACSRLAELGCDWAIGPMDGSTWRDYRVIIEGSAWPRFPGEPTTDPVWADWLARGGFEVIARYQSLTASLLPETEDERLIDAATRLRDAGVSLRQLDQEKWNEDLAGIHSVSVVAFANAYLYQPISLGEFMELYEKARPLLDPRLIWLAERHGQCVGYMFGFRHPGITTEQVFCAKTLAILPERRLAGLGALLLDTAQRAAHAAGFRSAMHCLEREDNPVKYLSARYGAKCFRRYALFGKRLRA